MEIALSRHEHKPLQINPIKHSQPMGAALAFMGIRNCLPLMHGSQGCASYTKVFFTRHFNEPIPVYNTSVSDITAVLDGGDYSILLSIENITTKNKFTPELIGLHTTGLTETKGDDVRGVGTHIEIPYCYVNTPDYEGGMQSGWALTCKALIDQLTCKSEQIRVGTLAVFVYVSLTPIECEKLKCFCESFGFETYLLPDLSTSMDGYFGEAQGKLAQGGIGVAEIAKLGECESVITIGASMAIAAKALLEKNSAIRHYHFDHLMGQEATDNFVALLMELRHIDPMPQIKRWRGRLQDAMLDTHFDIGSSHFVVLGEPDMITGICALLESVGGTVEAAVSTVYADVLESIKAKRVFVGDLEDALPFFDKADMVIGNFHTERLLHSYEHKALLLRGYPNYEELGNALKHDILYEGSTYFLFEVANLLKKAKHHG
ncbi:MAG: nitrogenase iron-molybdenum cofactor biosynthesis protein NifN [Campylobacterales bacterium]|nr:nitrogenase iron-molybdenum cofactor biosynthesis protein NifN [Campylobacterales bacterium]